MPGQFRFSFGPWNIHEGADPFGPTVRPTVAFAQKLAQYKKLGFDGVQFHDDDAVPDLDRLTAAEIARQAAAMKAMLDGEGLVAEFVAPRLWEDPHTIDGAFTSNNPADRQYAFDRLKKTVDIARGVGTKFMVLWLAREGTYIREAKDARRSVHQIVEALNAILAYDKEIRVAIEPKPNEPMDLSFIPTIGHAVGVGYLTADPARVGALVESAHAILAGLDPSEEMAYALAFDKLWSVHLNDQNGLKFDEDKAFGAVDLRRALAQVWVLDRNNFGQRGEFVGLDVKAMRTQKPETATQHLANSREIFLSLLEVVRKLEAKNLDALIRDRNYELLEIEVIRGLLGK